MRARQLLCLAVALLALCVPAAGPALAADPPPEDYVPTFTRADLWLHGNGSPLGNLDAREGRYLRWDTTTPTGATASIYNGNNYQVFVGTEHDPAHFLTMKGNAVGDLDAIAFDLYFTGWAQLSIGCPLALSFQLVIDGETILSQSYTGSDGITYERKSDTTLVARFVLTHLWEATKDILEYGPEVQHEVYLNVQNFYACNEVTWQYDAADVPSGLIVNLPAAARAAYAEINVLDPPPPPGAPAGARSGRAQ